MKNFIKCFSAFCMLLVTLLCLQAFAAAENKPAEFQKKYNLIFALELLENNTNPENGFTRAEAAKCAVGFAGCTDEAAPDIYFADVSESSVYSNEIKKAWIYGIMTGKGAGLFYPNDKITSLEFGTVLLRATGYEKVAQSYGGYPAGYEKLMNKYNLSVKPMETPLSVEDAAKMLAQALDMPICEVSGVGKDEAFSVDDSKTVLNTVFHVYEIKAAVTATEYVSLRGRKCTGKDYVTLTNGDGDSTHRIGNINIDDIIGINAKLYWRDDSDNDNPIIAYAPLNGQNKITELEFKDIEEISRDLRLITYSVGKSTKTMNIASDADFIYNGRSCYEITPEDIKNGNGKVVLIQSGSASQCSIIKIYKYDYYVAAQVNAEQNTVFDRLTGKSIKLDVEDTDCEVSIYKYGKPLRLSFINEWDVLCVTRSKGKKPKVTVEVSDCKINGKVEAIDRDSNEITVSGEKITVVDTFDTEGFKLGDMLTVCIDTRGYGIGYVGAYVEPDYLYGYLINIAQTRDTKPVEIRMLTAENKYENFFLTKKFKINNESSDYVDLQDRFYNSDGDKLRQLIGYRLNSSGEIHDLYMTAAEQLPDVNRESPLVLNKVIKADATCVYTGFGMTVDNMYNMMNSALIFDVSLAADGSVDENTTSVRKLSTKPLPASAKPSYLAIYNSDNMGISQMGVYVHQFGSTTTYEENHKTQVLVVKKLVYSTNPDTNDIKPTIIGMMEGREVKYSALDDIDISVISRGDVLLIWVYNNEITNYRLLYTRNDDISLPKPFGNMLLKENDSYDASNLAYRIVEIAEGRSSTTAMATSRAVIAAVNNISVFRDEKYPATVVRAELIDGTKTVSATADSATRFYVFHTVSNYIDAYTSSTADYSYDCGVLFIRYGMLRDVVAYVND